MRSALFAFAPGAVAAQSPPQDAGISVAWTGVLHSGLRTVRGGTEGVNAAPAVAAAWMRDAYRTAGAEFLSDLVGDFAIALCDHRARRLLLAIDALAQRPLYYAGNPREGLLAFASDTRRLRRISWVGNAVDDQVVVDMLLRRSWNSSRSLFANIAMLEPGTLLSWNVDADGKGTTKIRRYWGRVFAATGIRTKPDFLDAFAQTFREAVTQRLSGSRGTAILMSGGYDSTAVAGMAASVLRNPIHTGAPLHAISATFEGLACDETARIRMARDSFGLAGIEIPARSLSLSMAAIERQVAAEDFPLFNMQQTVLAAELQAARELGVDTVLSGHGGDEIADDNDFAIDLLSQRGILGLVGVALQLAPLSGRSAASHGLALLRQKIPPRLKRALRALARSDELATRRVAGGWLQPDVARLPTSRAATAEDGADNYQTALQRRMHAGLNHARIQFGQRATAMDVTHAGFRYGAPFLDRRLFELILGSEPSVLARVYDAGQYKPLISTGLSAYMPPQLTTNRWKVFFESYNRLQVLGALESARGSLFESGPWRSERYVSKVTAQQLVRDFSRQMDADVLKADETLRRLYRVIGIEVWLRQL